MTVRHAIERVRAKLARRRVPRIDGTYILMLERELDDAARALATAAEAMKHQRATPHLTNMTLAAARRAQAMAHYRAPRAERPTR